MTGERSDARNRRQLLRGAACSAGAALLGATGCARKPAAACADLDKLSDDELTMRTSFHYVDASPDPAQACAGCAFFTAPATGGVCGNCRLLRGAVSPKGHCTSWSAAKRS